MRIQKPVELLGGGPAISIKHQDESLEAQRIRPQPLRRLWAKRAAVLLGLAGFLVSPETQAQSYSIDWYKISGGGGTSTGGVYSVSGTIGQHDASGPVTGGNYSLTGGFWALYALQTPGAPRLTIYLTATNTAVVWWPSPSSGWSLQANTNLGTTNWVAPPQTVTDDGTRRFIIVSPPSGNRFYRLFTP